jgi:hypothetical protein
VKLHLENCIPPLLASTFNSGALNSTPADEKSLPHSVKNRSTSSKSNYRNTKFLDTVTKTIIGVIILKHRFTYTVA